jgi:hypothetical protein
MGTMTRKAMLVVGLSVAALLGGCGGEAALGEECGEAGVEEGECEEGAICAKPSSASGDLVCIKICTDDAQCNAATEECNGVEGSNVKGCRLK